MESRRLLRGAIRQPTLTVGCNQPLEHAGRGPTGTNPALKLAFMGRAPGPNDQRRIGNDPFRSKPNFRNRQQILQGGRTGTFSQGRGQDFVLPG